VDETGEGEAVDFTPLTDFYCDENKTQYIRGLGYTATSDQLKRLVQDWVKSGLVEIGRREARLGGFGTVT